MMETLTQNFKCEISEENGNKTHADYAHLLPRLKDNDRVVYVVRDGRDVLSSCYTWWNLSGESQNANIYPTFKPCTFKEYIEGKIKIPNFNEDMVKKWEMDLGLISDPIDYWMKHVQSYLHSGDSRVVIYSYESLKTGRLIKKLGRMLRLEQRHPHITPVNKIVGYYIGPERKQIKNNNCKWKKEYSLSELRIFNKHAGEFLKELDYKVENEM